ncbi:hypothetical protein ACFSM5_11275 [Lacibacterium aquatile]|uniref:Uncharacterized protein n=1 Tax=Lacibacterium aquatile TaxID=1168082 RepID=A0ABW5DSK2_9PROT
MTKIVEVHGEKIEIWENVALVTDVKIWAETNVSGSGGGGYINQNGGRIYNTYITSTTSRNMQVWFKNQDGYEYYMVFSDDGLGFRAEQQVRFVYGRIGGGSYSLYKLSNLATRQTKSFLDLPTIFTDQLWPRCPDEEGKALAESEDKQQPGDPTIIASCGCLVAYIAHIVTTIEAKRDFQEPQSLMFLAMAMSVMAVLTFLMHRLEVRNKKGDIPMRLSLVSFLGVFGVNGALIAAAPVLGLFVPALTIVARLVVRVGKKKQLRQGIEARKRGKTFALVQAAFAGV